MNNTSTSERRFINQAKEDAFTYEQNVKAFHMNWITFIIVIPLLFILNLVLSPSFIWVVIVGLFWGLAIALHGLVIFGLFAAIQKKYNPYLSKCKLTLNTSNNKLLLLYRV